MLERERERDGGAGRNSNKPSVAALGLQAMGPIETIPAKVSEAKDETLETTPAKEGGIPESTTEGEENL